MKTSFYLLVGILFTSCFCTGQSINGQGYGFAIGLKNGEVCLNGTVSAGPFKFSKEVGCTKTGKLKPDKWHSLMDVGNLDFFIKYRKDKGTFGIKADWKGKELSGWRINIYSDGSVKEKGNFATTLADIIKLKGL